MRIIYHCIHITSHAISGGCDRIGSEVGRPTQPVPSARMKYREQQYSTPRRRCRRPQRSWSTTKARCCQDSIPRRRQALACSFRGRSFSQGCRLSSLMCVRERVRASMHACVCVCAWCVCVRARSIDVWGHRLPSYHGSCTTLLDGGAGSFITRAVQAQTCQQKKGVSPCPSIP